VGKGKSGRAGWRGEEKRNWSFPPESSPCRKASSSIIGLRVGEALRYRVTNTADGYLERREYFGRFERQ